MIRTDRRVPALPAVLFLAAALHACGGDAADGPAEGLPPLEAPEVEDVGAGLSGDELSEPLPVTLEPVNESGVEGRATTIPMGDSLQLSLMVQGLPREGDYAAHIHRGTCETGGGIAVPLNPVRAESDGMGRSITVIPGGRMIPGDRYFVQVHGAAGAIACGDVHGD